MANDNMISFRKNSLIFVGFTVLTVFLVLLFVLCKQNEDDKPSSKLSSVLEGKEAVVIPVIGAGGKISLLTPDGVEIEPCAESSETESGKIVGKCDLTGIDLLAIDTITILRHKKNPDCMDLKFGGNLYLVHETNDTRDPKRWRRRHFPCHTANANNHIGLN